jgi:signal transduction histidine kinase
MVDNVALLQTNELRQHRDAIVQAWMTALIAIGVAPLRPGDLREQLRELTEQILQLLSDSPSKLHDAQQIGKQLALLVPGQPDMLERTYAALSATLLPAATNTAQVAQRLIEVLGHISTGYMRQTTARILEDQERSRIALEVARARALAALRERQAQLELVLNHLPIILMTIDDRGDIHFAAGHGFDLAGRDPESLIGESIFDQYTDFPDIQNHLQHAIDGDVATRIVVHQARTYELWFVPVHTELARLLVMGIDITDRVRADEERLGLERAIQASQRHASLGLMAGGVVHDFQNLLAVILGNANLLRLDLSEVGKRKEELTRIEQAARQATTLVRQLLAYSRPSDGTSSVVNLNFLIDDMVPLLRAIIPEHVALDTLLAPDLEDVSADATQIRQVVMNLVINAAEAIGADSGKVLLATAMRWEDEPKVLCQVSDNGCGMDSDTIKRIFDPFFTTKKSGRGLGLAALQSIINQHGGVVQVQSEVGRGTVFTVELPCVAPPATKP